MGTGMSDALQFSHLGAVVERFTLRVRLRWRLILIFFGHKFLFFNNLTNKNAPDGQSEALASVSVRKQTLNRSGDVQLNGHPKTVIKLDIIGNSNRCRTNADFSLKLLPDGWDKAMARSGFGKFQFPPLNPALLSSRHQSIIIIHFQPRKVGAFFT